MMDDLEGLDDTPGSEGDRVVEGDDALRDLLRQARDQLFRDLLKAARSGSLTSDEKHVLREMLRDCGH